MAKLLTLSLRLSSAILQKKLIDHVELKLPLNSLKRSGYWALSCFAKLGVFPAFHYPELVTIGESWDVVHW